MLIVIASCQKAPELTLSGLTTLEVSADGGSGTISFTTNRDWSASWSASWLSVSPSSGSCSGGPVTVNVRCEPNTTYEPRTATVTITAEGLSQTVTVSQPANEGIIVKGNQSYTLSSAAQTFEVEVQSNIQYEVSTDADWISHAGTKGLRTNRLTFSVKENATYDDRSATVTIRQQGGSVTQTITVRQVAKDGLLVDTDTFTMSWKGGTLEVETQANVEFDVTSNADWIHYVQTKALSTRRVVLTVDENAAYSSRSGKVTIRQKDGAITRTITVNQGEKDGLEVDTDIYEMSQKGGTLEVGTRANVEFDVTPDAGWIHYVQTKTLSNRTVVLTVEENQNFSTRSGRVTMEQKNGPLSQTVTIRQAGKIAVESITLDKTSLELNVSETVTLTATVSPSNATDGTVTWTSSNPSVATVDASGKVTTVEEGSATITAKAGDKSATCSVTVVFSATSVTLDKTSLNLTVQEVAVLSVSVEPHSAAGANVTWTSSDSSVATVEGNGKVAAVKEGTAVIMAKIGEKSASCSVRVEASEMRPVDLGLSVQWASCNVGATRPFEAGKYFAWAETEPKTNYSASTYKWLGQNNQITKYTYRPNSGGTVIGDLYDEEIATLELGDDAAYVALGRKGWKLPTPAQVTELRDRCTWSKTTRNGVPGYEVKSKVNGNSIFLPMQGRYDGNSLTDSGSTGYYWTNTAVLSVIVPGGSIGTDRNARAMLVDGGIQDVSRFMGLSVRPVTFKKVDVTGVTLTPTASLVEIGAEIFYRLVISPNNATDETVVWSTSDPSVATIDPTRKKVDAVGVGTATITVTTADGGFTASATVVVSKKVSGLSLNHSKLTMQKDEQAQLIATLEPNDVEDKTITWTSSDDSTVSVDDKGLVTALKSGTARITATSKVGNKSASCDITVVNITGLSLNCSEISIDKQERRTIIATVIPNDAADKTILWTSSDPGIVAVDDSGVITGVEAGQATITANTKYGGKTASCLVTVYGNVTGITLDQTEIVVDKGENFILNATLTPEFIRNTKIYWSTSDSSIADVNSDGVVYPSAGGVATITAKTADGGLTATCQVTVRSYVSGVRLDRTQEKLEKGNTVALKATVSPEDASDSSLTWSSSDPTVASVNDQGVVTALKNGESTISVKTNDGGYTASCVVSVWTRVAGITLDHTSLALYTGEQAGLAATISPADASDQTVRWTSSNPTVASVDGKGVITANEKGEVVITATTSDGSLTATCLVTVMVHVTDVAINPPEVTILKDNRLQLTATVLPENASDATVQWSSNNSSIVSIDNQGVISARECGTATITVRTNDRGITATCQVTVVMPDAIDLGLSIKWASFNLGATSPEGYGDYYAWGETEPKSKYDWETYKWANGSEKKLTKYCSADLVTFWEGSGAPDNKLQLDIDDDAAHKRLGGRWRMPTFEEWMELIENCKQTLTTLNGIRGYRLTGPNGNSIFLPAAGNIFGANLSDAGSSAFFWSSSIPESPAETALGARYLISVKVEVSACLTLRAFGCSIRPVSE